MPLESLLLSRDPEVIRVLRPALQKLSIDVEVCSGVNSGQEILSTEKFDAVLVDCDDLKGAVGVLESLRKSASNQEFRYFRDSERRHQHTTSLPDGSKLRSARCLGFCSVVLERISAGEAEMSEGSHVIQYKHAMLDDLLKLGCGLAAITRGRYASPRK